MERQLRLRLVYARSGETSRDLMYSFIACHGNCMHRPTCVIFKCVVAWKTVPFHDEKLLKILYIFKKLFHTAQKRGKKKICDTDFLVSVLKISMIPSSTTRRSSFTYISRLMWSPLRDRMMHNVQSPSLKTSDEEFVKKITDFRDYCSESASWAERTD